MDMRRTAPLVLAMTLGTFELFWSGTLLPERPADLVSQAEARIGRRLTPVCYAGVARRTTRRQSMPAPLRRRNTHRDACRYGMLTATSFPPDAHSQYVAADSPA